MYPRPLRVLPFVIALAIGLSSVLAERELEFAKGLQKLQLYELSFEQFKKVLAIKDLSDKEKMEAELAFADAYMAAADATDKSQVKDEYLNLAAQQLDSFLKSYPDVSEVNDVRYKKAMIQQSRAAERSKSLERIRDKGKATPIVQDAEKLFADSISQFESAANKCKTEMDKISGIARDKKLIERKNEMLEMFLKATNQASWTHFYWAEMYEEPVVSDPGKEKQQLDQSISKFKKFVDDYNYVIALSGRIGIGACHEKLGDMDAAAAAKDAKRKTSAVQNYEKATEEFRRVIQKRPSDTADPFRFHAYFLIARTYKKMGELDPSKDYFNDAIKNVNVLIEQLPDELIFQEPTDEKMRQTQMTLKKAMIEKSEAFFNLAKGQKDGKAKNDNIEKGNKAITDVIKSGGPIGREATEVRNKWAKVLGLREAQKSAIELIALAKEKFDEGDQALANPATAAKAPGLFNAAVDRYQDVILRADPTEEAPMIGESWQQIGLAYFKMGRYFEAALAFGKVPEVLPDHPKAADIAFASTQLFGHVLDHEHCDEVVLDDGQSLRGKVMGEKDGVQLWVPGEPKTMDLPANRVKKVKKDQPLDHMMDIYVGSLKKFARKFPEDKRATEAVFRSADALRAGGRFKDAAELYETIPSHALQFEKACYLAGQCYWAAYLSEVAANAGKAKEAAPLWQKAVAKLNGYLKWAEEQPIISEEHTRLKRYWMAKSRLRLANVYSYETVAEYEKALEALNGFEQAFFLELQEQAKVFYKEANDLQAKQKQLEAAIAAEKQAKRDTRDLSNQLQVVKIDLEQKIGTLKEIGQMPVEIHTYRIMAYCGLGKLEEAKAEYALLEKQAPTMDPLEKSKLSRILAMGYLAYVKNLEQKKVPEAELKKAQDLAAAFLMNVPQLNPNLSATDLVWYGARLFELNHEEDAAKVFNGALAKLEKEGQKYSPQYWSVVSRVAAAYEEAEKWQDAMKWLGWLLNWEKVYVLCCRNQELTKQCYDDRTIQGDLLNIWQDRGKRGEWLICLLLGDGTFKNTMAAFKDDGARAKAVDAWKNKETRKQAFAKFGVKQFDPTLIGIGPELRLRLAMATEKTGNFKEALDLWEALGNDIQQGTPVWLNAKYHQVLCLASLKEEKEAKAVLSAVIVAYPGLGAPDKPELEQKFLAMIKEKFSKEASTELMTARADALNPDNVKKDMDKINKEAIDSYRVDMGDKKEKKQKKTK